MDLIESTTRPQTAPAGDVTLMFTDIEGSTRSWDVYQQTFAAALQIHNERMRDSIARHSGFEVKTIGDSFMVAFPDPLSAACCALEMLRLIETGPFDNVGGMRVRIGLHTGDLYPHRNDYFGPTVNHTARIESAAHGGQVVMSEETAQRIEYDLPEGATLTDAGLHQLKDLGAPIRLFLLSHSDLPQRDYPPLRTMSLLPHNFPAQNTSFIGRQREQRELLELIVKQKKRLITLIGPGGTGKTRLSMQVAAEAVQEFKDGIWLVELAPLSNAREVPAAVALALKIPISGDKPIPAQIFAYLREKKLLIVFDNFEHVIDAAKFVSDLQKQCRHVVCLVTSQHLLQVAGEVEYPLSPLDLPQPGASLEECFQNPTVQLFTERATAAKPSFELSEDNLDLIVEICRRLEGLPLAIELTANLVRALTPQQILPRLQDRFKLLSSTRRDLDPRQRTLRGALDWSYELLTPEEQAFFAEISVFAGGFFLEDLEEICTSPDGFLLAVALRDKSLLKADEIDNETRYLLLETMRVYAAEKLEETGEADSIRERHAAHFLKSAEKWSDALHSSAAAMQRTIRDIDNLRCGMDWAIEQNLDPLVIGYGKALARFFIIRGLYEEGERRLTEASERAGDSGDHKSYANLLIQRGRIAAHSGDLASARDHYTRSLAISEENGDTERMIPALINIGSTALQMQDLSGARSAWEQALPLARSAGKTAYEATLLSNLCTLAALTEQHEEALVYIEQGIALHRKQGNRKGLAYALINHAGARALRAACEPALASLKEAVALFEEMGDTYGLASAELEFGNTYLVMQAYEQAEPRIVAGLKLAEEIGAVDKVTEGRSLLARLWLQRDDMVRAQTFFSAAAQAAAERLDARVMVSLLECYADYCRRTRQIERADRLTAALADSDVVRNSARLAAILRDACEWSIDQADRYS